MNIWILCNFTFKTYFFSLFFSNISNSIYSCVPGFATPHLCCKPRDATVCYLRTIAYVKVFKNYQDDTIFKLYDLMKVGRRPPLNGHGPLFFGKRNPNFQIAFLGLYKKWFYEFFLRRNQSKRFLNQQILN
jgi:hypothetical protein